MDDKFLIHVDIAERKYPLWIKRSEEEQVREAVKQINWKIMQYRKQFSSNKLGIKDFLAMAALQFSIENLELKDRNDTSPFTDKIDELTGELEAYLKEK